MAPGLPRELEAADRGQPRSTWRPSPVLGCLRRPPPVSASLVVILDGAFATKRFAQAPRARLPGFPAVWGLCRKRQSLSRALEASGWD